jgi:hypothetical protein
LRLLHDCATVGRVLEVDRPSSFARLESEIGDSLAALLCSALTGDQARPHSWETARGGRIVVLHPELPTAVSPGMGRNMNQRVVSPLGASQARERKSALNEQLQHERRAAAMPVEQVDLACECSDESCSARIMLEPDEYAFLQQVSGYYAVSPGHVSPDDHVIVGDAGRFAIVE